jgi:hypothetical protein
MPNSLKNKSREGTKPWGWLAHRIGKIPYKGIIKLSGKLS